MFWRSEDKKRDISGRQFVSLTIYTGLNPIGSDFDKGVQR